jgi:hypothetical protein
MNKAYINTRKYNIFDYIIYVLSFPIVVVRFSLVLFIAFCIYLIILVDTHKKYVELTCKYFSKIVLILCGFYNIKVKNKAIYPNQDIVIVYNHSTILDSLLIFSNVRVVAPVIYYKMYNSLKIAIDYCNGISVNTETPHSNNAINVLNYKGSISIAPEGCITNGKYLTQFKTGAFITGKPVLPVLLKFPGTQIAWCVNNSIIFTVYTMLCNLYNNAEIELLPLQYKLENESYQDFANRVRNLMSKVSGIPTLEIDGYLKFHDC